MRHVYKELQRACSTHLPLFQLKLSKGKAGNHCFFSFPKSDFSYSYHLQLHIKSHFKELTPCQTKTETNGLITPLIYHRERIITKQELENLKMFIPFYKLWSSTRNILNFSAISFAFFLIMFTQLCYGNFTVWEMTIRSRFSEFDTFLTSFALLMCIAGLFTCVWCSCCGHEDYFQSWDQRRIVFRQYAEERAAINRGSKERRRKRFGYKQGTMPPVTWV